MAALGKGKRMERRGEEKALLAKKHLAEMAEVIAQCERRKKKSGQRVMKSTEMAYFEDVIWCS